MSKPKNRNAALMLWLREDDKAFFYERAHAAGVEPGTIGRSIIEMTIRRLRTGERTFFEVMGDIEAALASE